MGKSRLLVAASRWASEQANKNSRAGNEQLSKVLLNVCKINSLNNFSHYLFYFFTVILLSKLYHKADETIFA
jgi:type VI protein secretion system component Hcp